MNLWERLFQMARAKQLPELPKISSDLWGRTLEAHIRLDQQSVQFVQLEDIVKGLASEMEQSKASMQAEIDKLRMQVEVLQAHETRRRNG